MGKSLKGKELGVGISQRKDGYYVGRVTNRNGKRESKNFKKLQECRNWVAEMQFDKEHGSALRSDNPTVEAWFDYWYEKIKKPFWKKNTQSTNMVRWEKHIKPVIGGMLMADVMPINCIEIFNVMYEKGLKKSTMIGVKELLHGMFESALENQIVLKNPVTKSVRVLGNDDTKIRFLTVSEQKEYMERIKNTANYNFYAFALQTGMRVSEILALTWDDVNFDKKFIHVNKTLISSTGGNIVIGTPKTKTSNRKIPMTEEAKKILLDQKKKNMNLKVVNIAFKNHIFLNRNGVLNNRRSFDTLIESYCNKYNVPLFSMHSLRHTFATRCIEAGMRPKNLQVILGHSNINITMNLYVHASEEANEQEIVKLEKYMSVV